MNAEQMRAVLGDEITQLRAGKRLAKDVNAVANAASKILASVRLELQYAKLLGVAPRISFIRTGGKAAIGK